MGHADPGPRRALRIPGGPRVGPGRAIQPRPRRRGCVLHPHRRLCGRGRRLRPRLLRGGAERGPRDGPPATDVAGVVLGGVGAGRYRSDRIARQRHRGIRRGNDARLRHVRRRAGRRLPADRPIVQRRLGSGGLCAGVGGSGGVGGYGVFVVVGGVAYGGGIAAVGGVRSGAGWRRHRQRHTDGLRGIQQASWAGTRRPVQALRRAG
ncbi:Uncharacterised protein [Mycobacterium tuberculosis]|nr:Uncharacterised protein [Mycobacterium tuberculosis]